MDLETRQELQNLVFQNIENGRDDVVDKLRGRITAAEAAFATMESVLFWLRRGGKLRARRAVQLLTKLVAGSRAMAVVLAKNARVIARLTVFDELAPRKLLDDSSQLFEAWFEEHSAGSSTVRRAADYLQSRSKLKFPIAPNGDESAAAEVSRTVALVTDLEAGLEALVPVFDTVVSADTAAEGSGEEEPPTRSEPAVDVALDDRPDLVIELGPVARTPENDHIFNGLEEKLRALRGQERLLGELIVLREDNRQAIQAARQKVELVIAKSERFGIQVQDEEDLDWEEVDVPSDGAEGNVDTTPTVPLAERIGTITDIDQLNQAVLAAAGASTTASFLDESRGRGYRGRGRGISKRETSTPKSRLRDKLMTRGRRR